MASEAWTQSAVGTLEMAVGIPLNSAPTNHAQIQLCLKTHWCLAYPSPMETEGWTAELPCFLGWEG